jgi:ubiquinone/menaquinone biosynthesis C-methylase UbiE
VGIDLSIQMINAAKKRRLRKTDLVLASSNSIPLKDETVDFLVSISTLKADSTLPLFLAEMDRIGGKGGVQAVGIFHQRDNKIPERLTNSTDSSRVSERETIYFLRSKR